MNATWQVLLTPQSTYQSLPLCRDQTVHQQGTAIRYCRSMMMKFTVLGAQVLAAFNNGGTVLLLCSCYTSLSNACTGVLTGGVTRRLFAQDMGPSHPANRHSQGISSSRQCALVASHACFTAHSESLHLPSCPRHCHATSVNIQSLHHAMPESHISSAAHMLLLFGAMSQR
jgi:hypothetical protein